MEVSRKKLQRSISAREDSKFTTQSLKRMIIDIQIQGEALKNITEKKKPMAECSDK